MLMTLAPQKVVKNEYVFAWDVCRPRSETLSSDDIDGSLGRREEKAVRGQWTKPDSPQCCAWSPKRLPGEEGVGRRRESGRGGSREQHFLGDALKTLGLPVKIYFFKGKENYTKKIGITTI